MSIDTRPEVMYTVGEEYVELPPHIVYGLSSIFLQRIGERANKAIGDDARTSVNQGFSLNSDFSVSARREFDHLSLLRRKLIIGGSFAQVTNVHLLFDPEVEKPEYQGIRAAVSSWNKIYEDKYKLETYPKQESTKKLWLPKIILSSALIVKELTTLGD